MDRASGSVLQLDGGKSDDSGCGLEEQSLAKRVAVFEVIFLCFKVILFLKNHLFIL